MSVELEIDNKYKKGLNRNPFNEKLIHRYYIENLYFNSAMKKKLLPERFHQYKVQLIVPEDARSTKESGHRPDFTIYFKDIKEAYPIELKWVTSELKHNGHQIKNLQKNKGFLVALKEDKKHEDIDTVIIDTDDFQTWLAKNIFNLSHDSLSTKNIIDKSEQSWLVCARGTAIENFLRMMNATNKRFWAFKNSYTIIQRMFSLRKNDSMLFIFFKSPNDKGQNIKKGLKERELIINGWAKVKVKDPYYVCLEGEQPKFFEKLSKGDANSISERKWVHFFDIEVEESMFDMEYKTTSNSWDSYLYESSTLGGGLVPVPSNDWNRIYSELLTVKI